MAEAQPPRAKQDEKISQLTKTTEAVRHGVVELLNANKGFATMIAELQQEVRTLSLNVQQPTPWQSSRQPSSPSRPLQTECPTPPETFIPFTDHVKSLRSNISCGDRIEKKDTARSVEYSHVEIAHVDSARSLRRDNSSPKVSQNTRRTGSAGSEGDHVHHSRRSRRQSDIFTSQGIVTLGGDNEMEVLSADGLTNGVTEGPVADTLPLHWPRSLEPRGSTSSTPANLAMLLVRDIRSNHDLLEPRDWAPDKLIRRRCGQSGIIAPGSTFKMAWDVACVILVLYDLTVIPYTLAWDVEVTAITVGLWCTVIFWTFDIPVSCITGYYHKGTLVMEPRVVFRRYARTYMGPDMLVVLCDWFSLVIIMLDPQGVSTGATKLLRFAKLGRMLRILDMLRTLRFLRALDEIMERFFIEAYRVIIQISKILLGVIWCLHIMCCGWYSLGRYGPSDTGYRWTDHLLTESGAHEYFSSFQWAVAQLTLGSIDIPCTNTVERIYNIICLLVGLLFGSTLISALSATMVDFQMTQKEKNDRLSCARRYLRENNVSTELSQRVQQQIIERLNERTRLLDGQVDGLALLSRSLRIELRYEITRAHLERHPLFVLWASLDVSLAQQMSDTAVTFTYARVGDDVFLAGQATDTCFYIMAGKLRYSQVPETSPVDIAVDCPVLTHAWLAEAALWCSWIHVGTLTAEAPAVNMKINGDEIIKVSERSALVRGITANYCIQFNRRIAAATPPLADWPNDLKVPLTEFASIVLAMPRDAQMVIGISALQVLQAKKQRKVTEKLRGEVQNGRSVVVVEGAGEVSRVVLVIVLRIEHPDGYLLAHVGKRAEGGDIEATCQFPGGKQERDEMAAEAVDRLLEAKLNPLEGLVKLCSLDMVVSEKASKEHGVRTKYFRQICIMRPEPSTHRFERINWQVHHDGGASASNGKRLTTSSSFSGDSHNQTMAVMHTASKQSLRSVASQAEGTHSAARLGARAIYGVPERGKDTVNFYAWLRESEIDYYSTDHGLNALTSWLRTNAPAVVSDAALHSQSLDSVPGRQSLRSSVSSAAGARLWDLDEDMDSQAKAPGLENEGLVSVEWYA